MINKDAFQKLSGSIIALSLLIAVTLGCGLFPSKNKASFDVQEGCSYLNDEGFKTNMVQKDNCIGDKRVSGKDTEIVRKVTQDSYRISYGISKPRISLSVDIGTTVINEDYEHIKSEYVKTAEKLFQRALGMPMPEEAINSIKGTKQVGVDGKSFVKEIETPKYGKVKIESISISQVGYKKFRLDIKFPKYSS